MISVFLKKISKYHLMISGKYLFVAVLICTSVSCQNRELCFDHSHMVDFEVNFDWTDIPDAAPNTMVLQIFNNDGSHYTTVEFTSRKGGSFRIEAGEYKFLFHNGAMSTLVERGNTYGEYELTTKQISLLSPMGKGNNLNAPPRPDDSKDEPVNDILENIWGGSYEYIEILRGVEGQSVTLKPVEATSVYTVEVRNVKNMRDDIYVSAAMSGMAQSWKIADNTLSDITATIPFDLSRKDETTLESRFMIFGDNPEHTGQHHLSIYTSEKDYAHFDVTEQIHNAPDSKHIHIIVAGLEFKGEGEGMKPDISEWEEVDIDIPMN